MEEGTKLSNLNTTWVCLVFITLASSQNQMENGQIMLNQTIIDWYANMNCPGTRGCITEL